VVQSTAGTYEVEVWAGADDEEHFGRNLILPLQSSVESEMVLKALDDAAGFALKMGPE
jgi:hypothetical protein